MILHKFHTLTDGIRRFPLSPPDSFSLFLLSISPEIVETQIRFATAGVMRENAEPFGNVSDRSDPSNISA